MKHGAAYAVGAYPYFHAIYCMQLFAVIYLDFVRSKNFHLFAARHRVNAYAVFKAVAVDYVAAAADEITLTGAPWK